MMADFFEFWFIMSFLYDSLSFCQFLRLAGTVFVGGRAKKTRIA